MRNSWQIVLIVPVIAAMYYSKAVLCEHNNTLVALEQRSHEALLHIESRVGSNWYKLRWLNESVGDIKENIKNLIAMQSEPITCNANKNFALILYAAITVNFIFFLISVGFRIIGSTASQCCYVPTDHLMAQKAITFKTYVAVHNNDISHFNNFEMNNNQRIAAKNWFLVTSKYGNPVNSVLTYPRSIQTTHKSATMLTTALCITIFFTLSLYEITLNSARICNNWKRSIIIINSLNFGLYFTAWFMCMVILWKNWSMACVQMLIIMAGHCSEEYNVVIHERILTDKLCSEFNNKLRESGMEMPLIQGNMHFYDRIDMERDCNDGIEYSRKTYDYANSIISYVILATILLAGLPNNDSVESGVRDALIALILTIFTAIIPIWIASLIAIFSSYRRFCFTLDRLLYANVYTVTSLKRGSNEHDFDAFKVNTLKSVGHIVAIPLLCLHARCALGL